MFSFQQQCDINLVHLSDEKEHAMRTTAICSQSHARQEHLKATTDLEHVSWHNTEMHLTQLCISNAA